MADITLGAGEVQNETVTQTEDLKLGPDIRMSVIKDITHVFAESKLTIAELGSLNGHFKGNLLIDIDGVQTSLNRVEGPMHDTPYVDRNSGPQSKFIRLFIPESDQTTSLAAFKKELPKGEAGLKDMKGDKFAQYVVRYVPETGKAPKDEFIFSLPGNIGGPIDEIYVTATRPDIEAPDGKNGIVVFIKKDAFESMKKEAVGLPTTEALKL